MHFFVHLQYIISAFLNLKWLKQLTVNAWTKFTDLLVFPRTKHIVPQLSEGSSDSVMFFLVSFCAKDQLPGHQRLIDRPLAESQIINPQTMNPDKNGNKQTKQYITRANLPVFYRA